ncbi:MAG: hypothetical protein K8U03_14990 [Planctomycetia bacterium]|nr:hypothetical protein [Planctomycetia bacterium]
MNDCKSRAGSALRGIVLAVSCVLGCVGEAAAQEFRIESRVFDGKQLVGGSTTVFAAKTYDFLTDPPEAVVFDAATTRFTLLDDRRKVRCELAMEQVTDFCERLRERSKLSDSSYVKFLATPDFEEQFDAEKRELVLNSAFMVYRAKTVAARDTESLRRYQDFTYRQAQLNTVLNPGSQPPYARLKLHAALADRQVMAEEVTMRRASVVPNFGKTLRAEHKIAWTLDDADRRRAAEADEHATTYAPLPIAEYLRPVLEQAQQ